MRIVVYVMIALVALMMLLCYAMLVVASRADEQAEQAMRMYRTAVQQAEKIYKEQMEKKDDDN